MWSPYEDMQTADLGDKRLNLRACKIVKAMSTSPEKSCLELFPNHAEITAFYRFTGNENCTWQRVLQPHAERTAQRAAIAKRALVLHDTTDLVYALYDDVREHLGKLSKHNQGYHLHLSLVVAPDETPVPLGVLRMKPYVHHSEVVHREETVKYWLEQGGLYENESTRWLEAIVATQALLKETPEVIHVGDRETDIYPLMDQLQQSNTHFVFRAAQERAVLDEDPSVKDVTTALQKVPWQQTTRRVDLGGRSKHGRHPKDVKAHPARAPRQAELSFRATTVTLRRPKPQKNCSPSVQLNLVEVLELNPPAGQEPVRWVLMTSEPIETIEQILEIVDIYRARWIIEEYFKGLKTGCALQERQAESAAALLTVAALSAPIAAQLLLMRALDREHPDAPASTIVTADQIELLRRDPQAGLKAKNPTVHDVMMAFARLGGHYRSNGPPGWIVLMRGYFTHCERMIGWLLASGREDALNV